VDVSGVTVGDGLKTGLAIIVVDEPTGQNRIILSPEANHAVREEQEVARALKDRPDLLIMQLEIPLPTVLAALRSAKEAGVPVLLNPAPAVAMPAEAFHGLAHLVVNETEAATLSQCDEKVLDTEEGMAGVAKGFIERGVTTVIITLGSRGVYYMDKEGQKGLVPAEKAKVVDTTAAGDTFVGRYALHVVAPGKFDIATAVKAANHASAKTVERLGAQDSIPWRDELE
jgi:ribokinase